MHFLQSNGKFNNGKPVKNLFSKQLIASVPGRSCTLQLLNCIEELSKKLDEGHPVDIIYTDFCKALATFHIGK